MSATSEIILDPSRMRIIQVIAGHEKITANEICLALNDISRTTIYRHIGILINAGIITVVSERRVRGSVERSLSLNTEELSKHETHEEIPQQLLRFLMSIYTKFEKHYSDESREEINTIFFNQSTLLMNDNEFYQFSREIQALLKKYTFDMAEERKPREISIISSPSENE